MNRNIVAIKLLVTGIALGLALPACDAQTLVVPQIADGGGWRTTVVIVNTASSPASATLSFFMETSGGASQPWNVRLQENVDNSKLSLQGGQAVFLHTTGVDSSTSQGWAQLQSSSVSLVAYAVFTFSSGGVEQSGTAPAVPATTRILMPFDNTGDLVTDIAICNPTGASESISASIQNADGTTYAVSIPDLPAQGHTAFVFPNQFPRTAGKSGLIELYVSQGGLAVIGLLANTTGGLTSAPAYGATGSPIILPPAAAQLQSVTLSAASASGLMTLQGKVLLTAAAPAGGASVTLSSSSSAVSVPATVNVAAGATSATFSMVAAAVSSAQTVTITASYQGSSASAPLSLLPSTVTPSNSWFTSLTCSVLFQPVGYSSGNGSIIVTPDTGTTTFSALAFAVGSPTQINLAFSNGKSSNSGNTLSFNTLSAPGAFEAGNTTLSVSSSSLSFTWTQTSATPTYKTGSISGTFSLTGLPSSGSAVTAAGSVAGTCFAATQ